MPARLNYEAAYAAFRLEDVEGEFVGSFASGLIACVE